jgi:vesicle-fusing ATPase
VEQVRTSDRTHLVSVLMYGPPGSGKTALAASIAVASKYPFIKLISPEAMVGFNETAKIQYISKIFNDSYKSPASLIVVDNIERILGFRQYLGPYLIVDWTAMGARFSNAVLQTLLILFRKRPPKSRRLLIIGTTSEYSVLRKMDVLNSFDAEIPVPTVSMLKDLEEILKATNSFGDLYRKEILQEIENLTGSKDVKVGIKKILSILETSQQDEDIAGRFVNLLSNSIAERLEEST